MKLLESLRWRYATKQFDPTRKIDKNQLKVLKEAVNLAPTSFGLQLLKVLVITNYDLKKKLTSVSWNQTQVEDCSHLFVFCNVTKFSENDVDDLVKLKRSKQQFDDTKANWYKERIMGALSSMSDEKYNIWTSKQCYIALSHLMTACADLRIDSCPMEGFISEEYNKILDLDSKNLNAAVICPVGYRAKSDNYQFAEKVRKNNNELFVEL
jgi:nitroreductase